MGLLATIYEPSTTIVDNFMSWALVLLVPYFIWRLWRFTICPIFYPSDPRQLPYIVPFIGHTISFMRCAEKVYKRGKYEIDTHSFQVDCVNEDSAYFHETEPYAITIAGSTTVVVRDTKDLAAVWKNSEDLSYDPFVTRMLSAFGIAQHHCDNLIRPNAGALVDEKDRAKSLLASENPQKKSYIHLQSEWFKHQLLPGGDLSTITTRYHQYLNDIVRLNKLPRHFLLESSTPSKAQSPRAVADLGKFCRYLLSHCALRAFFGEALFDVEPKFAQVYQAWEDDSWKVFYNYPHFLARELHTARLRAIDSLVRYYQLPEDHRPDTVWIFKVLDAELGYLHLEDTDRAGMILMICWAINNNAHYICFWMLINMLCDPDLLSNVRAETDHCIREDGSCDLEALLHSCPHLDAVWHECLRLYNASTAVRKATAPCVIGGKTIHIGDQIFGPVRNWQLEQSFFGDNPSAFSADRWLKKNLTRSKGYTPFGGGHTYCPGRFFAQREAYMLIALTLNRFDLTVTDKDGTAVQEPRVPDVQVNLPAPAAMQPVTGIMVAITDRK